MKTYIYFSISHVQLEALRKSIISSLFFLDVKRTGLGEGKNENNNIKEHYSRILWISVLLNTGSKSSCVLTVQKSLWTKMSQSAPGSLFACYRRVLISKVKQNVSFYLDGRQMCWAQLSCARLGLVGLNSSRESAEWVMIPVSYT